MDVTLYTDGAAKGNPGPGGYGIIIRYNKGNGETVEHEHAHGVAETTNNRMEMMAVIVGLEAIKVPCNVVVITDSKYVVNAFNEGWLRSWKKNGWRTANNKPVKNLELWHRLIKATKRHNNVSFVWVQGHCGDEFNERCDRLASDAAEAMRIGTKP